ncbi:MAG: hypothetical protein HY038_00325 [Nitrospirae bacterium]|jgi:hypothetical protein|nr:hypothetical protein [Nitrospirota bacterium]
MTSLAASPPSLGFQGVGLYLLAGILLLEGGCVSRNTYNKTRTEVDEFTRALETERADVKELDQQIAGLQATNRRQDAVTTELRAAIQREEELLPIMRQRADERLALLQAQVAGLVNQSRVLARQMADAKQEGASLQAMVNQYEQEVEESQSLPNSVASAADAPASGQPTMTQPPPPLTATNQPVPPPQVAQTNPTAPAKSTAPSRPAKVEPVPVDDSWTGMITNWLSSLWNWIFG